MGRANPAQRSNNDERRSGNQRYSQDKPHIQGSCRNPNECKRNCDEDCIGEDTRHLRRQHRMPLALQEEPFQRKYRRGEQRQGDGTKKEIPPGRHREDRSEVAKFRQQHKKAGGKKRRCSACRSHTGEDTKRRHIDGEGCDNGEHAAFNEGNTCRVAGPCVFMPKVKVELVRIFCGMECNRHAVLRVAVYFVDRETGTRAPGQRRGVFATGGQRLVDGHLRPWPENAADAGVSPVGDEEAGHRVIAAIAQSEHMPDAGPCGVTILQNDGAIFKLTNIDLIGTGGRFAFNLSCAVFGRLYCQAAAVGRVAFHEGREIDDGMRIIHGDGIKRIRGAGAKSGGQHKCHQRAFHARRYLAP